MISENEVINKILEKDKEINLLGSIQSLLAWDQECLMPSDAVQWRSEQMGFISGFVHKKATEKSLGELVDKLKDEKLESDEEKSVKRLSERSWKEANSFPHDYVVEKSMFLSKAHSIWVESREKDNFSIFESTLEKIVDYAKKDSEYLGTCDHPYDNLLDIYEEGMTVKKVDALFNPIGDSISDLVKKISTAEKFDNSFLSTETPIDNQKELTNRLLKVMNYSKDRGRCDEAPHPFTIDLGPDDVRITTRYHKDDFKANLYGVIHEAGHALYELGSNDNIRATLLGGGVSLGIHESQSRFWENFVGKSLPAIEYLYSDLKELFPEMVGNRDAKTIYKALNCVEPSFIRIEADEVTYGLHIILRYRLEKLLIEGSIKVKDIPDLWRCESKKLLGIEPEKDKDGVLQDIHWSGGSFGYFPTYLMGNVYGAQFLDKIKDDLPEWDSTIREGNWSPILDWLKDKIHSVGSIYTPTNLLQRVTGETLSADSFIKYLYQKFSDIYKL
ncbi:MAG: carboxypeptidase M32 [Spirochaetaceae bacterium]|jgi:carboxypeptidase Taq|nr:carboxypeptidase M32 [Spirochaetaceae bacterium]